MQERRKRQIASLLSFFIIGTGQLYRKRYVAGVIFLLIFASSILFFRLIWAGFNYWFLAIIFSWIILWVLNIIDAYKGPFYQTAPCDDACPAGIKPSEYIPLVAGHRFADAYKTIIETVPFISTLGRVCPAPCEEKCSRSGIDDPVAIRYIKRYLSQTSNLKSQISNPKSERIAVIGAGPCGLTCAYFLRKKGYAVSIFEKEKKIGGMLSLCIPEYRLPREVLNSDIENIINSGVEIKTNITIGKDITFNDLSKQGYKAIFLATGTPLSKKLSIEGIDADGVLWGVDFLRGVKDTAKMTVPARVVVVGGGNVAIDVASTCLRLGAKEIQLFCLEKSDEMPAYKCEIEQATDEGVILNYGWGPKRILQNDGRVSGIEFTKCISVFDEEGRFNPSFDESETTSIDTDMVIMAIGQSSDLSYLHDKVKITEQETIRVKKSLSTNRKGTFAGGDVVTGPNTVVEAIADGKRAAVSIDRYIRKWRALFETWLQFDERVNIGKVKDAAWLEKEPKPRERIKTPFRKDRNNFEEVELSCSEQEIIKEAKRCLLCPHRFDF